MEIICDCGKHIPESKKNKYGSIFFFCKICRRMYRVTISPFNKEVKK